MRKAQENRSSLQGCYSGMNACQTPQPQRGHLGGYANQTEPSASPSAYQSGRLPFSPRSSWELCRDLLHHTWSLCEVCGLLWQQGELEEPSPVCSPFQILELLCQNMDMEEFKDLEHLFELDSLIRQTDCYKWQELMLDSKEKRTEVTKDIWVN